MPLAIAIAYAGGWLWTALVTLAAIGLLCRMADGRGPRARRCAWSRAGVVALAVAGFCLAIGRIDAALVVLAVGLVAVALIAPERRNWAAAGFLYAAAAEIASVLVRLDPVKGFVALIFVLLIVWVTDSGGYFAGRGIGGPKLWPQVSPKKTWAGAVGGFAASLAVAVAFAAFDLGKAGPLLMLSAVLSVVSQLGDLFEFGGEAAFRRQGLQPHHSRPWRANGSAGWICRSRRRGGTFWVPAGRRRWRRPRSYGLVKR